MAATAERLRRRQRFHRPTVLLSTKADVERFARKTSVSAGIVADQYGHHIGTWSRFGKLRESNQDK